MTALEIDELIGEFPHELPRGYRWLIERELLGFQADTALQPWYFLDTRSVSSVSKLWPREEPVSELFTFARRRDCDDIVCFAKWPRPGQVTIVVVHGWTSDGYTVVGSHETIWGWWAAVVSDIEEWVERGEPRVPTPSSCLDSSPLARPAEFACRQPRCAMQLNNESDDHHPARARATFGECG
jgi:hypothetical protein